MTGTRNGLLTALYTLPLLCLVGFTAFAPRQTATLLQKAVNPGALSQVHASLQEDCRACHTPGQGVRRENCVLCHADAPALFELPTTAFHAHITECAACHPEHQGKSRRPTVMDHQALAIIGLRELSGTDAGTEAKTTHGRLSSWLGRYRRSGEITNASHPRVTSEEAILDCASCHINQGQTGHARLMGPDCASCHSTAQWTIPLFQHPSPRTTECAQCHEAPPSHYMEHFRMVSQKVAKRPTARVEQCYSCHQVDAWNNIKGVGWYDHH